MVVEGVLSPDRDFCKAFVILCLFSLSASVEHKLLFTAFCLQSFHPS